MATGEGTFVPERGSAGHEAPQKKRYAMVIDLRRCIGCQSCTVACKEENNVPPGVYRTWVKVVEKGKYPHVSRSFVPILCNNCVKPICLLNCPVQATYQREDGIVMIDQHRCIGCKYCIASCPYGVRYVNPLKKYVQKCTFCHHRVDNGLVPACVETCIGRARIFGDMNDPSSEVSQILATEPVSVLKPEMGTEPRVFYVGLDLDAADALKTWQRAQEA
ncbi:MAG: 4Fe-4S dicluster domain-containing protein [Nitrospirae bacterium]|nr:4Fe-4S dicluster domain-containing protein [Nitrospirota bacterium]